MRLIAKTLQGLESVLAQELISIGAENITPITKGVQFEGDKRVLYRANIEIRTALQILYPIVSFRARREEHLYESIQAIDWSRYMSVDGTLAIDAVVNSEYFKSPGFVALKVKDAIVEQFRDTYGRRPSIDTIQPTLRIHIEVNEDNFEVSLDSSGDPLCKRGFERQLLDNPINEVLAAGMILLSDWKVDCDFIDPMCSSGTLLIEAAMIAYNIPPMHSRDYFALKKWSNFDANLWEEILTNAKSKIKTNINYKILGFDSAFQALRVSQRNIQAADLEGKILVERLAIEKQEARTKASLVMINPLYSEQLKEDEIKAAFKNVGESLKKKFINSAIWLMTSNIETLKLIGLNSTKTIQLNNGESDCIFVKYEFNESKLV